MTSHISMDSDSSYRHYEPPKKKKTESEVLLEELRAHLKHVSQYDDEKHLHKKNVLNVAIGFLENKNTFEDLSEAIKRNPSYNKAIFSSETEKYVYKAISMAPDRAAAEKPPLTAEKMKLVIQLQTQLHAVEGKSGGKHADKAAVLHAALDLLNGKGDKAALEQAIEKHPRYNEAIFTSKTEQLINKVLDLAPKSEPGLRL